MFSVRFSRDLAKKVACKVLYLTVIVINLSTYASYIAQTDKLSSGPQESEACVLLE